MFKILKSNITLVSLIPFFVTVVLEAFQRGSLIGAATWIAAYPKQFLITYGLVFALVNAFYFLPRRLYLGLSAVWLILAGVAGLISHQKLKLRGEPLLPWDFVLSKEAFDITNQFAGTTLVLVIAACLAVAGGLFVLLRKIPREPYRFRKPLTAILCLALLYAVWTEALPLKETFSLRLINWSQEMNYDENGMLLGFLLNYSYQNVTPPDHYTPEAVAEVVKSAKTPYRVNPDFKPNIVVVMSEAFWDPTLLEGITFSEDPLPYFHSLQQEGTAGTLISSVYGGGTANTEFEVLTGFSTHFLPRGLVPYVQYVHKPIDALPSILKRQGYEATAIHTYHNWFYRRNYVYRDLGFDKFISQEFFDNPERGGQYIRDTELSKKILEEIQATAKPDFIFAVSMQAHGPYSTEPNPENTITVSGDLTPESRAILENYTNLIHDVDKSLELLIEGLKQLDEPTIVVFFGDHLPMLGQNYDVYRETQFFQGEDTYSDYLKMYSVPLVVWDNFSSSRDNGEPLRLSAGFLGPYILERAQKEGNPMTNFLYTLAKSGKSTVVSPRYQDNERLSALDLERYRLLQYDYLIGHEYVYRLNPKTKPTPNTGYILGDGRTVIEDISPPEHSTIYITGENFRVGHTVYVNGQPVETNVDNNHRLVANLPWYFKRSKTLVIQVKLLDNMGNVISESNTYELDLS